MIHLYLAKREGSGWSATKFADAVHQVGFIDYTRKTLVVIHGYGAMAGFANVSEEFKRLFPDLQIIAVFWPSSRGFGKEILSYFKADSRTKKAAEMLASVLQFFTAPVVVEGHSLGNDVASDLAVLMPHLQFILTAPAVPNNRRFACVDPPVVYYSRKDRVLRWPFRAASLFMYKFAAALGLNGPAKEVAEYFEAIDCTAFVFSHGAYPYIPQWCSIFVRDVWRLLARASRREESAHAKGAN